VKIINQPLVSVLVTPYNQKAYIRQTLDGILMQRCSFDFEVIIGDDCSTDGTREICQEYAENHPDRIVLCLNDSNKGFINNYFDIFLQSHGKYIADCGGDDYWLTDKQLQEQVDLLESHPEVSLVAGNWLILDQKTGNLKEPSSRIVTDWYHPTIFGKKAVADYLNADTMPRIVLSSSCFRGEWAREAYQKHPEIFRGENITCEDLPLTLSLLLKGPFYISKTDWLVYRVLENSISHSENRHQYMNGFAFKTFCQTLDLAKALGIPSVELPDYVRRKAGEFALYFFLYNDPEMSKALMNLLKKHRIRPLLKWKALQNLLRLPFLARLLRNFHQHRNRL
jgi:glycosyltransferase involved in cell wall biosynthesis